MVSPQTVCAEGEAVESKAELPTAAVLSTAGGNADSGLDSVLPAALEKLGVVNITARPGLDLGAIQLAIDCVDETVPCLKQVAAQSDVQIVIAPALKESGGELIVTLLYFDARGEGEVRRVARRQSGHELSSQMLDDVPNMLRELFQLRAPDEVGEGTEPPLPKPGPPVVGPIVVMSTGAAVVIAGAVFGLLEKHTQSQYDKAEIVTETSRDHANDLKSTGHTQAALATAMFIAGPVIVAAGGVWLALALTQHRDEEPPPTTAFVPVVAPGHLGFALTYKGGGL